MASNSSSNVQVYVYITIFILAGIFFHCSTAAAVQPPAECISTTRGECYNKTEALRLKVVAIAAILATSMAGVCLPLFSRSVPALRPDRDLFVVIKAFASGVILATGYMHVLPDSFDDLRSPCLPETPWHKFPFTTFVAMLSAIVTLMVDSLMMTIYNRTKISGGAAIVDQENPAVMVHGHGHGHGQGNGQGFEKEDENSKIKKNRIVAQVLEMGIIVHSVVIGLSMGASENPCTIRPLVAALCFHQFFEGMGLDGCILQAEYGAKMKSILAFFFATTTPLGILLGIGLSSVYSDTSPTALVVEGLLNAVSAGLLNYMALVHLLASEFMGAMLQSSVKLQLMAFAAVFFGAGGMSVMALWA